MSSIVGDSSFIGLELCGEQQADNRNLKLLTYNDPLNLLNAPK